jgi:hypothetical protein
MSVLLCGKAAMSGEQKRCDERERERCFTASIFAPQAETVYTFGCLTLDF